MQTLNTNDNKPINNYNKKDKASTTHKQQSNTPAIKSQQSKNNTQESTILTQKLKIQNHNPQRRHSK
jgi:hypothetical protein